MENHFFLKKDLTKIFIIIAIIVLVMVGLYVLDRQTNFVFQLGGKLMNALLGS